ncbi:MAG: CinA-like protein [Alphaproteobacteria bacterium MarineAlpha5_Bin5]|nr:MAG: CinA-like protein [Alphaproteobacteria bacterium MarineAlpha5_Bin5]PPR52396.1 MAG: CinA-like protein [Alphaproteobacteria bacterium MarineAlpha5_Bin4]|tara:strand:- start:1580 stop:2326 length:747 start_codon:yes stop_codon:yes gene_type:complete
MEILKAGILVIGDEILSGRTHDTNSNFIAKKLNDSGISLEEIKVIKDQKTVIIKNIKSFKNKYNYVFTTGGIGPTHDDITAESISEALNLRYCFHDEAYRILENYYPKGEFNIGRKKMAKMPENAELIVNPMTVAPGFIIENIYVLPGVPEIMQKMFINVLQKIKTGTPKKTLTINTNLYESTISVDLEKIQKKYTECNIGSYPFFNYIKKTGGVNIVVSSWTLDDLSVISKEIENMISLLGGKSLIV